MNYSDFEKKIITQDPRNKFASYDGDISFIPKPMKKFYSTHNPEDVEIVLKDLNSVKFYPVESLKGLQGEYSYGADVFVFASKEGDAILLSNDCVATYTHGSKIPTFEKLENSFDDFLAYLLLNIKKLR